MGIGTGRHHDDGDIARSADRATQLKSVNAREHDVNQHNIGGLTKKQNDCFFTTGSLVDSPAFVFKRQLDSGANSFIIFNSKDSCSHDYILPYVEGAAGTTESILCLRVIKV